jgi:hypothetical protein
MHEASLQNLNLNTLSIHVDYSDEETNVQSEAMVAVGERAKLRRQWAKLVR